MHNERLVTERKHASHTCRTTDGRKRTAEKVSRMQTRNMVPLNLVQWEVNNRLYGILFSPVCCLALTTMLLKRGGRNKV